VPCPRAVTGNWLPGIKNYTEDSKIKPEPIYNLKARKTAITVDCAEQ
jgi:hypothetical protein